MDAHKHTSTPTPVRAHTSADPSQWNHRLERRLLLAQNTLQASPLQPLLNRYFFRIPCRQALFLRASPHIWEIPVLAGLRGDGSDEILETIEGEGSVAPEPRASLAHRRFLEGCESRQ